MPKINRPRRTVLWSFTSDNMPFGYGLEVKESTRKRKRRHMQRVSKRTRSHHPLVPPVNQIVPVELYPVPGHGLPIGIIGDIADDGKHILGFNDIGVFDHLQIPK